MEARQEVISLDEARQRIGDGVVYQPSHGAAEDGEITGVGDRYVFVHYRGDLGSKATDPQDLAWLDEAQRKRGR